MYLQFWFIYRSSKTSVVRDRRDSISSVSSVGSVSSTRSLRSRQVPILTPSLTSIPATPPLSLVSESDSEEIRESPKKKKGGKPKKVQKKSAAQFRAEDAESHRLQRVRESQKTL